MEAANAFLETWMQDNMSNQDTKSSIERLDDALGSFYAIRRRNDYYDSKGRGKFLKCFQEAGCLGEELDHELGDKSDFRDCKYLRFHAFDDFPLAPYAELDGEARQKEIFRVLQYCYIFGISPNKEVPLKMLSWEDDTDSDASSTPTKPTQIPGHEGDALSYEEDIKLDDKSWGEGPIDIPSMNTTIHLLQDEIAMLKRAVKELKMEAARDGIHRAKVDELSICMDWDCERVIEWLCNLE